MAAGGHPSFFFAHDAAMEGWLDQEHLRPVPVLIADQPETGPPERRTKGLISGTGDPRLRNLSQAVFYRKGGPLDRASLLARSREEIARSGQLHVASGTIHPLLHFAWYAGCAKLYFAGCDGLPGVGYDGRLENRSDSTQQGAIAIRVHQEEILRRLALPREHLGTPPHRLELVMEIRVRPEMRSEILAWAERLLAQLRAAGCDDAAGHDYVAEGGGYWIKGLWPGIDPCVACLASAAYQEAIQGVRERLLEGSREKLRIAYRVVR